MAKFLVPMDFSKESYLALDWTAKLAAQAKGSQVYLLTVGPLGKTADEETEINEQLQREVSMLRHNHEGFDLFGIYRSGHIPQEVRNFCKAEAIDLVVMTTRGRFGMSRELDGSTTEETVRLVECPILVLHLNQTTADQAHERFEGFLPNRSNRPSL